MRLYLFFLIIFLAAYSSKISSQEIFAEQIWELSNDVNNDGWVNQGDIISFQVDITHNGKVTETISIDNLIDHEGLQLIPESVNSTKGKVVTVDRAFQIENIKLEAPWGYATITFSAKVILDPEETSTPITNHTTLSTSIGLITSNSISIPRRMGIASEGSNEISGTLLILLCILGMGILLGFASKRVRFSKLSKVRV